MKTARNSWGKTAAAALLIVMLGLSACQAAPAQPEATPTAASTATSVPTAGPTLGPTATPLVLEGAVTTDTGLQYLEITKGSGDAPKAGNIITLQYIASLPDGTELANTYTTNKPVSTVWGINRLLPGWEEGIGLMKTGGKAKLVLPPELAFGEQGSGPVPPNSQVVIEVELLSVDEAPQPTAVEETKLTKTDSGLQYYDLVEGDGEEAVKNSSVSTHYKIWIKTDAGYQYIDKSDEGTPVNFVIGRNDTVFPGWEEGTTGMKVGGKRLLVVPAELGMGAQGNSLIPANSVLVMEIELINSSAPRAATKVDEKDYTTTQSGLKYYDLTPGTGATPAAGQTVVVHYTGWLVDGTQFDSSLDRGQPFSFPLGQGRVIPGWDEGVATMKVGGKRQLVIPPELGYGENGSGSVIPPNATLIFEVELLEIQSGN